MLVYGLKKITFKAVVLVTGGAFIPVPNNNANDNTGPL
jgi:hypothetical protein